VKVAAQIARRDGEWISPVTAPEGVRYLVLFANAEGEEPWFDGESDTAAGDRRSDADLYGRSVAQVHRASDDFACDQPRFALDLDYLLTHSLPKIQPFLSDRPAVWDELVRLTRCVRHRLENWPIERLEMGFCHGDFQGGNGHIQPADRSLTFFDFDCCGRGWRAYDLAVFRWQVAVNGLPLRVWEAFLAGYQAERAIAAIDVAAIPYFVAVRQVWIMGLHCGNAKDWGVGWLNGQYFERSLNFLRAWERDEWE
jgi:Ser/Thr protein kinase RdoA (MazF antagonist)